MCLVDDLCRMPHQLPDPAKDHCLLRVVLPDFLALLTRLLSHGRYLRDEVSVFCLGLLELLLVRPLCQLPENIFGSAVVQGLVRSPGDVFQPEVLVLQILQPLLDVLEGISRKVLSGEIHVSPSGLPAGSCFRMIMRGRRGWSLEDRRRISG